MRSYLTTAEFWRGTGERAIRAFSWAFLAALGVPAVTDAASPGGFDVMNVGWPSALSMATGAALLSLLFSVVAGNLTGPQGSPSLVDDRPGEHRAP
jgi:hypothetical protein